MFKKVFIITLILIFSVTVYAADMGKLDSAGKQILQVLYQFAFWGLTIKALFECIKLGFAGNVKGAVDKAIGYAVLYTLIFFIPWLFELIIKDLKETIKKFKQPRRTQIIGREEIQEISNDLLIEDFTTTLVFTQQGYFKKTRKYSETQKVKEDDQLQTIIQCSNKDKAIFISNQGNAYLLNLWEVNEKTPSQLGEFLPNLLPLEKNEIIIGILTTNAYKGYAIYVFENGKIAKIPLSSFETKTNRTKLSNCLTDENGKVLLITQIDSDTDIELADCFSKIKIINTKDINEKKSRNSVGVTAWNCKKSGFKIISAKLLK
jgi:DNA gyrase subunit A